jgi:hypothetical protein
MPGFMHPPFRNALRSQAAKAAAYLIVVATLAFMADRGLAAVFQQLRHRERGGEHGGRIESLAQGRVRPHLLLLGSSRAAHGIDPSAFPWATYNLSHDGRSLVFMGGVLDLLEEKGAFPPAILLQVDREALFTGRGEAYALTDRRFLRTLWEPGNAIDRQAASWPFLDRVKFFSRLYPFNGEVLYLFLDAATFKNDSRDGFEPLEADPADSLRMKALFEEGTGAPAPEIYRPALAVLRDVVARARRNGSRVAAFTAPEYRNDPAYYAEVSRVMDSLFSAEGVPYLDFNRAPGWPLSDARLFKDAGHMNAVGAERMSRDLAEWLRPILAVSSDR